MNASEQSNEPAARTTPPPPFIKDQLVKPIIVYILTGLTVAAYLLQMGTLSLFGYDLLAPFGAKINTLILDGEVWRLFTPMFLHASIIHIGFNMYALYIIGIPLEQRFGHGRFLLLYLAGGFAGNVFSFLFTANPSLGASTAIFGLLGAQGVFFYRHRELFGGRARAALQNVIQVAVINFLIGLTPGIDNWGHLGGLLGGLLFTWISGPVLNIKGAYPVFEIEDERSESLSIAALMLVFAVFGALAATKFFRLWPR
jgi:rhomboid protease GluP